MGCEDIYCDVPVDGAIYLVNYTGQNTYATFVKLTTGSSEMTVPPSLNSGGCNFTILQGFSDWDGISLRTSDGKYSGTFYKAPKQITTITNTNSEGASCTHYWFSYGYTDESGKNVAVTSAGGTPADAYPSSWLATDGQYYTASTTFSWLRILVILLIFVIAIIVAVFLIKKYRSG
jgi:hypothetical protein